MRPTLQVAAVFVFVFLAAGGKSIGQTQAAKPAGRISWSAHQVERAAKAAKNANRLLGSLLRVTSGSIEGRYFYQQGTWWYWMPEGYWVVWDGDAWLPYQG
jgi:hypothetical protein